jgi:hypothetical protein
MGCQPGPPAPRCGHPTPYPAIMWHEVTRQISDWPSLRELLYRIGESDRLACRGQSRDYGRGTLYSTLDRALRHAGASPEMAATVERVSIQRFYQLAPNYLPVQELPHLQDGPSLLMLMRHYRAPTRLLDWTESIWIATFSAAHTEWDHDGIIWIFDRQLYDQEVESRFGPQLDHATATARWRGAPVPAVSLYDLDPWVCRVVGMGPLIPRVIAQQSMFTIGSRLGIDHAEFIDRMLPDEARSDAAPGDGAERAIHACKRLIRIPAALKPKILKELARMGITANSLFPGIDGVGQSLQGFAHYAALDEAVQLLARSGGGRMEPPGA